jgi:hypothetical protein
MFGEKPVSGTTVASENSFTPDHSLTLCLTLTPVLWWLAGKRVPISRPLARCTLSALSLVDSFGAQNMEAVSGLML